MIVSVTIAPANLATYDTWSIDIAGVVSLAAPVGWHAHACVAMGLEAVASCPRKRGHATQNGMPPGVFRPTISPSNTPPDDPTAFDATDADDTPKFLAQPGGGDNLR